VDLSCIVFKVIFTQPGVGDIDHSISFTSQKLSIARMNYSTTECEGLAMVYALQSFTHYLVRKHFKMYTNHSSLEHLVNKPMFGG